MVATVQAVVGWYAPKWHDQGKLSHPLTDTQIISECLFFAKMLQLGADIQVGFALR